MKSRYGLILFVALLVLAAYAAPGGAETEKPTARVHSILDEVMAIQNNPRLQGPEFRNQRRMAIKKIIADNFDFPTMSKDVLGAQWGKLSEAERKEFESVFPDLFQESYTRLVLDFLKQEKIVYGKEEVQDGKAQVKTTISRPNEEIPVDYRLADVQGKWMVEDVVIDGVSIIGNYQRSFGQVIQRESFKSLLQKMRLQQQAIGKSS